MNSDPLVASAGAAQPNRSWTGVHGTACFRELDGIAALEHGRPRRDERCTSLAGYVDYQAVATALLLAAHEVAGISSVITHAGRRGRGFPVDDDPSGDVPVDRSVVPIEEVVEQCRPIQRLSDDVCTPCPHLLLPHEP